MKRIFVVLALLVSTATFAGAQSAGERIAEKIVDAIFGDNGPKDTPTHKHIDAGAQAAFSVPKEIQAKAYGDWYSWEPAERGKVDIISKSRTGVTVRGLRSTSSTIINYKYKVIIEKDGVKKEEVESFPFTLTIFRIVPTGMTIDQETHVGWGVERRLAPRFSPDYAEAGLTFDSDNPSVVTVNSNGVMMGQQLGEANIYITSDNGLKTSTHVICVVPAVSTISVVGFDKKANLYPGDSVQLDYRYGPVHAEPCVRWVSSDTEVATVDENGLVTFISNGVVHISCVDADGAKGEVKIRVKKRR